MSNKIQLRGNCQSCGRVHAVVNGAIAKHGYTVDNGYFNGVCDGHRYAPMQESTLHTVEVVAQVNADAVRMEKLADELESGVKVMEIGTIRRMGKPEAVPFAALTPWEQKRQLESAIWNNRSRAKAARGYADMLEALAQRTHGTALITATPAPKAEPIALGEQRKTERGVCTGFRVDGARVYWKDEKGFQSWTGTGAWRRLELFNCGH